jgi:nicotinate-nucleotide pyrophosphorylase (carboxylating)
VELDPAVVRRVVAAALDEDLARAGDITTRALVADRIVSAGHIVARAELVLAGCPVAREVFHALDPALDFEQHHPDGSRVSRGERVASITGDSRPILEGERTALNFLMRMCGIATAAAGAVAEVAGTACGILDTRKTAPGLRQLDKYAVACGGATNHRMGLYDAVMIKDTHLGAGLSVGQAVQRARAHGVAAQAITAEVRDLAQLGEAIAAGAGRALLDNMDLDGLCAAVQLARGRIVLEASGGVRPGGFRAIAETGVDFISSGWLTHSAPAADLAMEMEPLP